MNTRWTFETPLVHGSMASDGHMITTEFEDVGGGTVGNLLLPYRLLSRNGWHGEAREMPHTATVFDGGIEFVWTATIANPVTMHLRIVLENEGTFRARWRLDVHAPLTDYELFQSCYFAQPFRSGGYVTPLPYETPSGPGLFAVRPADSELYREMYISLPRDEAAAAMLCDGRWQRGRHFTRFLPARYYALPLGFFSNSATGLDALFFGRRQDVFSVNMAYGSDNPASSVGSHNSLYLSLLGRDVYPGETIETEFQLVLVRAFGDAARHAEIYRTFVEASAR